MNLIELYKRESAVSAKPILFMASLSGVANAVLLFIINKMATSTSQQQMHFKELMMFAAAFAIFVIGKNYSMRHTAVVIEKILAKVRIRVLDKARKAGLRLIEDIGHASIHTKLTHNVNTISETALLAVSVCQSVIMLFFCSLYIAYLSFFTFCGCAGLIGLAILYFNKRRQEALGFLKKANLVQEVFFDKISGILSGFKELKVNRKRSDRYFEDLEETARENEGLMIDTQLRFTAGMMVGEITFYVLLAGVVFLLPRMGSQYASQIPKLVTAILFIMAPIINIVASLPMITRANMSISEIYTLEQQLDRGLEPESPVAEPGRLRDFREIRLENILFRYRDQYANTLFTLDNINLTVKRGELLFIVGGNGSGKSTVLKILTGLYTPEQGGLRVDDTLIDSSNYQAYRELFSVIFTDFHLFDKLYGIDLVDEKKIQAYLEKLELAGKTNLEGNRFSNIKLSTGQKKRLAVLIALLFDSDIYVFDELAADQAPEFRAYFYEVLLKEMKEQGKTLVVVSHDDRFFHVADRVVRMDYGRVGTEAKG